MIPIGKKKIDLYGKFIIPKHVRQSHHMMPGAQVEIHAHQDLIKMKRHSPDLNPTYQYCTAEVDRSGGIRFVKHLRMLCGIESPDCLFDLFLDQEFLVLRKPAEYCVICSRIAQGSLSNRKPILCTHCQLKFEKQMQACHIPIHNS